MSKELIREGLVYRCGNLTLWPYPSQEILASLYLQFSEQKILPIVFHQRIPPLIEYLQYFTRPESSTLGCFRSRPADRKFDAVGMLWYNPPWNIGHNWLGREISMGFLRGQPSEDLVTFAEMAFQWAFDNSAVDTICGLTPSVNRAANIFGLKMGMEQFGPIPDVVSYNDTLCGALVQVMTKKRWLETRSPFVSKIGQSQEAA